ncbi:MAG: hypothetical protein ACRENI_03430 [Gemmatimonadaceae bacterium]
MTTPEARRYFRAAALGVSLAGIACSTVTPEKSIAVSPAAASGELWAFTAPWDRRSARSLALHGGDVDVIVSGWVALDTLSGLPIELFPDSLAGRHAGARYMALVTSWLGDRFHPATIRALAGDARRRAEVAGRVAQLASSRGYRGLVLDFEGMGPADLGALISVARSIADSARARDVEPIVIAVPAPDTAAYPAQPLLSAADLVLVMLYDQHWSGSPPGAVATPAWAREQLALRIAEVGASRLIAALPLYGYLWRQGAPGVVVGFDEARRAAAEDGEELEREPSTGSLRASSPGEWELWVTDAALLAELLATMSRLGVERFAFWRLGLEDPAVWPMLGGQTTSSSR